MSNLQDPLITVQADRVSTADPSRVSYATGSLLEAIDFQDEQTYHRGRLATALAGVVGSGTVGGLRVSWQPEMPAAGDVPATEEEIRVQPGLAIDRSGRLIEIRFPACIRLNRWYEQQVQQRPDEVFQGRHGDPYNGVVVDLFVRFDVCPEGKTPAFRSSPFDALDSHATSRLRDAYRLNLTIRTDELSDNTSHGLPVTNWPSPDSVADEAERLAELRELHEVILSAVEISGNRPSHVPQTEDPNSVFLARIVIPASAANPPVRDFGQNVRVDNFSRRFVYPIGALASWLRFEDRDRNQPDNS